MRTTLNVDDDVLSAVKEIARLRESTAGAILSELARESLERGRAVPAREIRNRVPLLPAAPSAGIVTPDAVRALADP
jgi:hypothetical protein